jgi:outer membrane protein assembly factor BamA
MFTAGYTYNNVWYDDPEGDDSQSHIGTVGLTKQFGDRLSLFTSYAYRAYRPEEDYEYDSQTALVGGTLQVTPKLTMSGSVGYVTTEYKSSKIVPISITVGDFIDSLLALGLNQQQVAIILLQFYTPPPGGGSVTDIISIPRVTKPDDSSSMIWNATATYNLSERLSLAGGFSQSFKDSVNEGATRTRAITGAISYDAKIPVTLSVFHSREDYDQSNRQDDTTGGVLSFGLPLTPDLTLRVDGTYSYLTFDPDDEKIDRYGFRTGFEYQIIPKATVGVGYTYNRENSNVDENDYSNNIAFVVAKYTF